MLETTFHAPDGAFRVIDFAPRFFQYGRRFRPTQLVRTLEPIEGAPRVRVRCEPRLGWSKARARTVHGPGHVSFEGFASALQLATDIPLTNPEGRGSLLTRRGHLVLSWGVAVDEDLAPLCERFMGETLRYWETWAKHCQIPPLFQREVIRSALALKLHCFDDTGAVVASPTTSIPTAPDHRPRDLRYCRLRDAHSILRALHMLGHFEEREGFVRFLLDIVGASPDLDLGPCVCVDAAPCPGERTLDGWPGFAAESPMVVGHRDRRMAPVAGALVLALTPAFFDVRLEALQSKVVLDLVEQLARRAIGAASAAGQSRTVDSLIAWAAAVRMATMAGRHRPGLVAELETGAERIRELILGQAWCHTLGSFTSTFGGRHLDASLAQMAPFRFLPPDHPRLAGTIAAIRRERAAAAMTGELQLVEALAAMGHLAEARSALERACSMLSPLGLSSEAASPSSRRLVGNFPDAASHAALIHAAFAASPAWAEVA